ncbi:MAG: histidine kinase [Alphaproteobacteria bacterium]|nr:histidine kinase [Alphaproteobacteria bacterium]
MVDTTSALDDASNASLPNTKLKGLLRVAMILFLWTGIALVAASTAFIAVKGGSSVQWFRTLGPMLIYYYSWALMSVAVYLLVRRRNNTTRDKLTTATLIVAVPLVMLFVMPMVIHYDTWQDWIFGDRAPGFQTLGLSIFLFVLVGCLALRFYEDAKARAFEIAENARHTARLAKELDRARLDALLMQLNPHFLFNALNSIGALIETEKKEKAYRTTEMLGGLLRKTLERSEKNLVPLADEIAFVEDYVELEETRYGDRLTFNCTGGDGLGNHMVPTFILQPIIENAIKHALNKVSWPVEITLSVTSDSTNNLELVVTDNGPGLKSQNSRAPHHPGEGNGLRNVKKRLALIYGREDLLTLTRNTGGGAKVGIIIPQISVTRSASN